MCRKIMSHSNNSILTDLDNVGQSDFLHGDVTTTHALLANLVKRFHSDVCYTSIGPDLLIFVNPQKPLTIYSDNVKQAYVALEGGPPHVYSLVNNLIKQGASSLYQRQSLLLTGESGSGKSLNLSHALDYIHHLSANSYSQNVVDFNLFLNFFGGAMENYDSTRFIKLIELDFDFKSHVCGSQFFTYHLEKWRLTENVPNFHIFYVLLGGAESSLLKQLGLVRNQESYKILNKKKVKKSIPYNLKFDQYERAFVFVKKTFTSIDKHNFLNLLAILSAILKLGNVHFVQSTNLDGSEGVDTNVYHNNCTNFHSTLTALLGLDTNITELISHEHNPNSLLTKLINNIYSRLFSYLTLLLKSTPTQKCFKINLLDYTGFIEENNSFENFIVNYINEKVQYVLVDYKLRQMQETYIKDGLEWILIDTGHADGSFIEWIEDKFVNEVNEGRVGDGDKDLVHLEVFRIHQKTIEQQSTYKLSDFLNKNPPDVLPDTILKLFANSNNNLLRQLYKTSNKQLTNLTQIKINLKNCLEKQQNLSYIRCIKPSSNLNLLEPSYVKWQISYHRIIDYLKVLKNCYFKEFEFHKFLTRYKLLSLKTWPRISFHSEIECVKILLTDLCFQDNRDFVCGRGRVFLKQQNVLSVLEGYRQERMEDLAMLIQRVWRSWRVRKEYLRVKQAEVVVARWWRTQTIKREQNRVTLFKLKLKSIRRIQSAYILWKRRMYLCELAKSVGVLTSPTCPVWPVVPSYLLETSGLLRIVFHRWRCHLFRLKLSNASDRLRLNEKATASCIFRGFKAGYEKSVSHPFLGDYIRLRQNSQWLKTADDNKVVFCDLINKVTRSSGKFLPIVLVVTTTELLILDPRTLLPKYKISYKDLQKITMSTYSDSICVLHISPDDDTDSSIPSDCLCSPQQPHINLELTSTKGDIILHCHHLIEMVTKVYLVHKNYVGVFGKLEVAFANEFPICHHNTHLTLKFHPQIADSQLKINFLKKSNRLEFTSG